MKTVVIDISKSGDVVVDAEGFHGEGCKQVVTAMAGAIGKTTGGDDKPELYELDGVFVNV